MHGKKLMDNGSASGSRASLITPDTSGRPQLNLNELKAVGTV